MMRRLFTLGCIVMCCLCGATTMAASETDDPILVIDPQGHSAMIQDLVFTPDGERLISVADDKTIRVWECATGEVIKTFRGYMGNGPVGGFNTVAMSPNGKLLAVGGYLDEENGNDLGSIRVLNAESGQQIALLRGHENTVNKIAMSQDGQWLASANFDTTVKLWNLSDLDLTPGENPASLKPTITLDKHKDVVYSVAFSPAANRLVSASTDGTLRLWTLSRNLKKVEQSKTLKEHDDEVYCVDYSPDGAYIASGGLDQRVLLWSGDGKFLKTLDQLDDSVMTVAFSADGTLLFAGGGASGKVYRIPTGEIVHVADLPAFYASRFHPTQHYMATVDNINQHIILWDAFSGQTRVTFAGKGMSVWTLGLDEQLKVAFGTHSLAGRNFMDPTQEFPELFPLEQAFNFADMTFEHSVSAPQRFTRARTQYQGNTLTLESSYELQIKKGKQIEHDPAERGEGMILSYTFTPDGHVVVGSDFGIKLYDSDGTFLREFIGHTSGVYGVTVSQDGRILASASHDQTIKLWSLQDEGLFPSVWGWFAYKDWHDYFKDIGQEKLAKQQSRQAWEKLIQTLKADGDENYEILEEELTYAGAKVLPLATLFVASDHEWVCWTPQGYYAASAGGERYIGWHLNQGLEASAKYYPVSVFRKQFYHPELVQRTIALGDFERALEEINRAAEQEIEQQRVTEILPPTVEWLSLQNPSLETAQSTIRIQAVIQSDSELEEVKVMVNGRAQATKRGLSLGDEAVANGSARIDVEVSLIPGENVITIFAQNVDAGATSEQRVVFYDARAAELLKPSLYMVSIGISQYAKSELLLEYADDDAQALSRVFRQQEGKLYKSVNIRELYNRDATRANILEALKWLKGVITHRDVAVIFIAAHGINDEHGIFYLLPADSDLDDPAATGVNWNDLVDVLGNLPSRVLFFLDTCHSGQLGQNVFRLQGTHVENTEAIREIASEENGVVILAASTGREFSLEHPDWGHGAFTKAVLDGLEQGFADYIKDGLIHLRELDMYIAERVRELTDDQQHPTTLKPSTISVFPIVQVP